MIRRPNVLWTVVSASLCLACSRSAIEHRIVNVEQRLDAVEQSTGQQAQAIESTRQMVLANTSSIEQATRLAEAAKNIAAGRVHREEIRRVSIYFDVASSMLTSESRLMLDGVADEILQNPGDLACVVGFCDSSGDPDFNDWLSQRRAEMVVRVLATRLGAEAIRLTYFGLGSERPVADNETEDGRRQNRRVEVSILRPERGTTAAQVSLQD